MKKVLWTTLFWILVVAGFAGFLRFFDKGEVSSFISEYILADSSYQTTDCSESTGSENALTGTVENQQNQQLKNTEVLEKLEAMTTKLDEVSAKLSTELQKETSDVQEKKEVKEAIKENKEELKKEVKEIKTVKEESNTKKDTEEEYKAFLERKAAQNK